MFKIFTLLLSRPFRSLDKTKLPDTKVPNGPFERFLKEKVSLSMKDISQNSESVNDIVSHILTEVRRKDERFALRRLNSGNVDSILFLLRFIYFCSVYQSIFCRTKEIGTICNYTHQKVEKKMKLESVSVIRPPQTKYN